tara:strand:- start:6205 stop:6369 length:165 start_codon:yes stop_codon:yes gene_type:complete
MKLEPITIKLSKLELKWLLRDYERCVATADPDEKIYMHVKQVNKKLWKIKSLTH